MPNKRMQSDQNARCAVGLSVSVGSISAAHRNYLGVRCVPEAEVNLGILNVGFGGKARSPFIQQSL